MRKKEGLRWGEYRYHALDYEYKTRFGRKIWKLSLNGGMTCPNRDGRLGERGCIFCSEGGSGDFAASADLSVREQILAQEKRLIASGKIPACSLQGAVLSSNPEAVLDDTGLLPPCSEPFEDTAAPMFIAYFQAYTNTYAPVSYLRTIFTEAISHPQVCALAIATRPDCLGEDVIALLAELDRVKPVCVELGLQTIHEETARFIRRGYALPCFEEAVEKLHQAGLEIVVHTILGLPGEDEDMILDTMRYLNGSGIAGVKLQLLHILENTDLGIYYREHPFPVYSQEEYVALVVRCLEELSPDLVIHRLTGDAPRQLLIAPQWSADKHSVLNAIRHELAALDTWQGRYVPD